MTTLSSVNNVTMVPKDKYDCLTVIETFFFCTAQTRKNKQMMTLQHQLNRSAFFLHILQITSNILTLPCNILRDRQKTRHGMASRRFVSHMVISSKWLSKIFIPIFKEYLKPNFKRLCFKEVSHRKGSK